MTPIVDASKTKPNSTNSQTLDGKVSTGDKVATPRPMLSRKGSRSENNSATVKLGRLLLLQILLPLLLLLLLLVLNSINQTNTPATCCKGMLVTVAWRLSLTK